MANNAKRNTRSEKQICESDIGDVEPSVKDLMIFMMKMKDEISGDLKSLREEVSEGVRKNKEDIAKLDQEQNIIKDDILSLKVEANDKEQRSRNYSLRIFNLRIPDSLGTSPPATIKFVYDTLLLPILKEAVIAGDLVEIPDSFQLIEFGHTLNTKTTSGIKPIIIRFFSRTYRLLIFKKPVLTRMNKPSDRNKVFISEDLTPINFRRMMELSKDPRIERCFSLGGQIKYILKDDPEKKPLTLKNAFTQV